MDKGDAHLYRVSCFFLNVSSPNSITMKKRKKGKRNFGNSWILILHKIIAQFKDLL